MKFLIFILIYFVCYSSYSQKLQLTSVLDIQLNTDKYDTYTQIDKRTKQKIVYVYLKGTDKYVAKIIETEYEKFLQRRSSPNSNIKVLNKIQSFDSIVNIYDQYNRVYSTYNYVNNTATSSVVYYTYYGLDTNILLIENYNGKKREGEALFYYISGHLKKESYLINDKLEGSCISYFENGGIDVFHYHKKNSQTGMYFKYYENGFLERQGYLKKSKGIGEWVYYYPNGKIKEKGFEVKNKRNGWWFFFNDLGEFTHPKYYKNGKVKDAPEELGMHMYNLDSKDVLEE